LKRTAVKKKKKKKKVTEQQEATAQETRGVYFFHRGTGLTSLIKKYI